MGWGEIVAIALIALILGGAILYIVRAKKKGQKCIGCPYSGSCHKQESGECTCGSESQTKEK